MTVLIIGASSPIARGIASTLASKGYALFLAGRDQEDLQRLAADLQIRYQVAVTYGYFDAEKPAEHLTFAQHVKQQVGKITGIVMAMGYLGNQQQAISDSDEVEHIFRINLLGAINIINIFISDFIPENNGFIIGLSSVAGDRGRQSNFMYGSAKAGFTTYLQGLRNYLCLHAPMVKVLTVKPGFVDTSMTYGLPGLFAVAHPQKIGRQIVNALHKSKDVIYVPFFWRYIMTVIHLIPERIFKRLSL